MITLHTLPYCNACDIPIMNTFPGRLGFDPMNVSVVNGTGFWLLHFLLVCDGNPEDEKELVVVSVLTDFLSLVRLDMTVLYEILFIILRIINNMINMMALVECEPLLFLVRGFDGVSSIIVKFQPAVVIFVFLMALNMWCFCSFQGVI